MGFRNDITAVLNATDQILGPDVLDLRPTTCTIITRIWTLGQINAGAPVDTGGSLGTPPLQLPPWIKIRHVTQREIAGSGGRYEEGDVIIGPIRPTFVDPATGQSGGFTQQQIAPVSKEQGKEIIYKLTSEDPTASGINGDMALVEFRRDRAMRYTLVVGRKRTTP